MPALTPKQKQILAFIEENERQKGTYPTFREIQKHFDFSSLGTVYSHIRSLKKKKVLQDGKFNRVEIVKSPKNNGFFTLPIIGHLSQGEPPKMWSVGASYSLPAFLVPNEHSVYLFSAKGKGLQSELIDDKDLIIVQAGILPEDGDIIFALFEGNVIIRTYFQEGNRIRLESKSKGVHPLFFEEDTLLIQGLITAIIRPLI